MDSIYYQRLGFKCGLEIHQQIASKKLFCRCPSEKIDGPPDYKIKRYLRSAAGETGEIDVAAKFESQKKRHFIYEGHSAVTSLVELDEAPPVPVNKEALSIALTVSLLLNARPVDEIQFMRKTVVDGSNVSGFQRTALIAVNGFVPTSKGNVGVPTICLEEEAAQKLEDHKNWARYNIDRLGIALIEIATDASIKDPQHAKEVAAYIGMVLRSVDGVKRGLGTIRQDVNISIAKGARTEIKGFQELRSIPKVIEHEIARQLRLIKQGKKLNQEVRKAEQNFTTTFLRPMPGAARMYVETDVRNISITEGEMDDLKKNLPKLVTEKTQELQKKYNLKEELAKELVGNKEFESFTKKFNIEPAIIAQILVEIPKELQSRLKLDVTKLRIKDYEDVLDLYEEKKINKDAVFEILADTIRGNKIDLGKYTGISEEELTAEIKKIIEEKPGLSVGAYMGIVMGKYRGKVNGKKASEIIESLLK